jgi:hypothetical protein
MHPKASCACAGTRVGVTLLLPILADRIPRPFETKERALSHGFRYTPEQAERLRAIHSRLIEARRELDALIGDAYLRPRASIVPVHFLDLAAAVEKLRWAEKEWRELDQELSEATFSGDEDEADPDEEAELVDVASN